MAKDMKGFSPKQAEFLIHHAQQFHGPDDFDSAVAHHVSQWATPSGTHTAGGETLPQDFATPQLAFEMQQNNQRQKISNLSTSPPSAPSIQQASGIPNKPSY